MIYLNSSLRHRCCEEFENNHPLRNDISRHLAQLVERVARCVTTSSTMHCSSAANLTSGPNRSDTKLTSFTKLTVHICQLKSVHNFTPTRRLLKGLRASLTFASLFEATRQFLEEINKWTSQHGVSPLSKDLAVKFLMARKFDVLRAIELFHSYRETRLKEGIVRLQPHEEPLRSELLSGKFTVLGAFPARLKKVLIVGAPVWFRVPYNLLSLLLKEKLRERVQMVKTAELKQHLPRDCLPQHLGGLLPLDAHAVNQQLLSGQNGRVDPVDELVGIPMEEASVHVPGPESMRPQELMAHLGRLQRSGVHQEYEELRKEPPPGTFHHSQAVYNQDRNRYGDVLCLDQTRVKLKLKRNERSDYINASYMDGYKQKNAYIGTQGPLERTYGDFWRMVWEQNVLVIVMTTRTEEGSRRKCGQYWPLDEGGQEVYGHIAVVNQRVDRHPHYNHTTLELHNTEQRQVSHFQYLSWPDYGVPTSAVTLIDFLNAVKKQQKKTVKALGQQWTGHALGPPMVVHCSAGIGRTGTFCALDICLSQLQDVGSLNVHQTVKRMRTQRAFSIQTPDQYYFCYNAILEHAQRQGLLPANQ
ncbi:hypothetical protein WMY93_023753 [Mugilogobius chulae]|uniref:protein-tyrosine-phosphatase n=1 Tax=Mugilogobius chulae TaxID=88201 RepID=A0AAW0NF16_9GOBI